MSEDVRIGTLDFDGRSLPIREMLTRVEGDPPKECFYIRTDEGCRVFRGVSLLGMDFPSPPTSDRPEG